MPGVLYKKEREVLEFLSQFQRHYGYSPTLGEIAKATGHRSNSTVHAIIRSLVEKSYVQKVEGNSRVLKIIDQKVATSFNGNQPSIEVPLMGYIAAGRPLEPHTDPNAVLQISASLISGSMTAYALQVKGESLIEDGILDGDYVIIEKTNEPMNGDIVVALVDNNLATLKKFNCKNAKFFLKQPTPKMEPFNPKILTF